MRNVQPVASLLSGHCAYPELDDVCERSERTAADEGLPAHVRQNNYASGASTFCLTFQNMRCLLVI